MAQTAFRVTGVVAGMTGIPGAEGITQLLAEIWDAAEQVKANKKSCQLLVSRVKVAQENLDKGIKPSCGQEAIKAYIEALTNIQVFLKKQNKPRNIFKKYLTAKDVNNQVSELINEMHQSSVALTLAVVTAIDHPPAINIDRPPAISVERSPPIRKASLSDLAISDDDIIDHPNEEAIPIIRGSQNHVRKRFHQKGFGVVAEKNIGKFNENLTKDMNFREEIGIWKELREAPGILKFYGIVERNGEVFTISEWASNSDLESYFKIENPSLQLDWDRKVKIASQVAAALAFCHGKNILHHDVRSHNVLLDKDLNAKLTNFQLSRKIQDKLSKGDANNKLRLIRWTAPERMVNTTSEQPRYTKKCDVYSYGILLWEIATQQLPFGDVETHKVPDKVKAGERPISKIPNIPPEYKKLMVSAWDGVPGKRPPMTDISKELCKLETKNKSECGVSCPLSLQVVIGETCIEESADTSLSTGIKYYKQNLYEKAWPIINNYASQKMSEAQYYAGIYYIHGHPPVKKNIKTGLNYWKLAADNDYAEAAYKYSSAYSKPDAEAGKLDSDISQAYFKKAVELKHPNALYKAGIYSFQKGRYEQGEKFLKKAHTAGNTQALKKLNELMMEAGLV
ncbi:hypothetical protein G9A89_001643 [Geosiphon pyriformis]|nr:hypothetical protein G9A89_001643 [Geosiphon pyriformis]